MSPSQPPPLTPEPPLPPPHFEKSAPARMKTDDPGFDSDDDDNDFNVDNSVSGVDDDDRDLCWL